MTNSLRARLAAIACAALVSTACVVGAVGPATAGSPLAPVASGRVA